MFSLTQHLGVGNVRITLRRYAEIQFQFSIVITVHTVLFAHMKSKFGTFTAHKLWWSKC